MDIVIREPVVAYGKKKFTVEEYLEYENASEEKHEYYQGEIFAMAGAKISHNTSHESGCIGRTKVERQIM
jgi:Uma2 family endonuclease